VRLVIVRHDPRALWLVPLTIAVICEQLGINQFSAHKIQRWSQAITAQISQMQDREQMLENAEQICELQNFIIGEMKAREHEPREDMISDIVHAQLEDGGRLTFKEAVSLIRALIIAGNETTATAISNLLFVLATQPDVAKMLRDSIDDDDFDGEGSTVPCPHCNRPIPV